MLPLQRRTPTWPPICGRKPFSPSLHTKNSPTFWPKTTDPLEPKLKHFESCFYRHWPLHISGEITSKYCSTSWIDWTFYLQLELSMVFQLHHLCHHCSMSLLFTGIFVSSLLPCWLILGMLKYIRFIYALQDFTILHRLLNSFEISIGI